MSKSAMIPLPLIDRIIDLLEYLDVSKYDIVVQHEYSDILAALETKKRRLELRDNYAKIIYADNEDDRHEARIRYLREKRLVKEPF
jgi:uncharacterized tellurite resistance protein B-like protein